MSVPVPQPIETTTYRWNTPVAVTVPKGAVPLVDVLNPDPTVI